MGWAVGYDYSWHRDIGYGVPAICDHPDCKTEIDRGLSYVCGDAPYGGEHGCGLYFCSSHLFFAYDAEDLLDKNGDPLPQMCARCVERHEHPDRDVEPFDPKPDVPEWINHKLTDESWQPWRDDNPREVARLQEAIK